jgi:hypothetical protein
MPAPRRAENAASCSIGARRPPRPPSTHKQKQPDPDPKKQPPKQPVELRGGERNVKVATKKAPVAASGLLWNEDLTLEVLDNASELRIMLCRDKLVPLPGGGTRRSTHVVAACGIYVADILDAVPIDKYFELFKPAAGGEGGFIRLALDFAKDPAQLPQRRDALGRGRGGGGGAGGGGGGKAKGLLKALLAVAVVAGAGVAGYLALDKSKSQNGGNKQQPAAKKPDSKKPPPPKKK